MSDMSTDTSASLRALRLERNLQEWEDSRRALAHRRAMRRPPLPRALCVPARQRGLPEVRVSPPQARCRDLAIHNTFMCGDMEGVYAVLKDPTMVHALMETVHEEMVWAPELGMWTMSSKVRQTSALRLASISGHTACVEELLCRGAEVNADPGGSTALHDACVGGHPICVQLLLSHGADPELLTADGSAPLHLCASAQGLRCAQLLLEGGADINVRSRESRLTPLHVVAQKGLEEHVELFLCHGADVLATNREGETPLNAACSRAERPMEAGQYLRVVQKLLDAGADPKTAGRKRHTPLHNACANCCPGIVNVLLQRGAEADVINCAEYTPMECLLQVVEDFPIQYAEEIARSLLNHGAKPVSPKTLKMWVTFPGILELMLNSYRSIPCYEWIDHVAAEAIPEEQRPFYQLLLQQSGQPRSLQHLCRWALRRHLGARCQSAISKLEIPSSVKDYLLLCNDQSLH